MNIDNNKEKRNNNKNNSEIEEKRPNVIACRLTDNENDELQLWKRENNIKTNSDTIRTALAIAINGKVK